MCLLVYACHSAFTFSYCDDVESPICALQALEESGLPKKLRMVVMCNKPSFEFRAFQVRHMTCCACAFALFDTIMHALFNAYEMGSERHCVMPFHS